MCYTEAPRVIADSIGGNPRRLCLTQRNAYNAASQVTFVVTAGGVAIVTKQMGKLTNRKKSGRQLGTQNLQFLAAGRVHQGDLFGCH
jgi:hypothetical protein